MTNTIQRIIPETDNELIKAYRSILQIEMKNLGTNGQQLTLIKDATIRNALKRNRKPETVAWALLQ